eukprot:5464389-Alexandrium_andersonii.AAC.1
MPSTARARSRAEGGAESWTKCNARSRSSLSRSRGSRGCGLPPPRGAQAFGGGHEGADVTRGGTPPALLAGEEAEAACGAAAHGPPGRW